MSERAEDLVLPLFWEDGLMRNIFGFLDDSRLVELRSLGRRCKEIIDKILKDRFLNRWGLAGVIEGRCHPVALTTAALPNFAREHLVDGKSLCSIALHTDSDICTLRRVNNIISDYVLNSRRVIYVPVKTVADLKNCHVEFRKCPASLRHWLVVVSEDDCDSSMTNSIDKKYSGNSSRDSLYSARVLELVEVALGTDRDTTRFYLDSAGGDAKAAIAAYREDQRWDRCMNQLRKKLARAGRRSSGSCKQKYSPALHSL